MTKIMTGGSAAALQTDRLSGHWGEVGELLATLYRIVDRLEALFPGRKFTPDGHLVGSIGEVIAAHLFDLSLLPGATAGHDAVSSDGRRVQIKFTQGNGAVALRVEPDHLVVLRLTPKRSIEVVYNGKGRAPWDHCGRLQSNGQRSISLSALRTIDVTVPSRDRLALHGEVDCMISTRG